MGKNQTEGNAAAKPPPSEVVFHTYPKLLFIWPIILAGLLFWPLAGIEGADAVLGWLYLLTVAIVILTLGIDLERDHAAFWLIVFIAFFFLGRWLEDAQGFTFFGDIYRWFVSLDVRYNAGFGVSMSVLLGIPYAVMIVWSRLQHKWRITHNEFEHYSWGRADDSLARGAKRVRSTYPDLLELLLFGAGTLIVYSATGRSELRRIPHVPLIFLVRKRINRLLEATAVTTVREEVLAAEETEAEREEDELSASDQAHEQSSGEDPSKDPL